MKKAIIFGFLIGFLFGSAYVSMAKNEMESSDAESVVGYGYNGNTLVAIKVDANGVVQVTS